MWSVEKVSRLEEGKNLFLCRVLKKHSTNDILCRVFFFALGKPPSLPSVFFTRQTCFLPSVIILPSVFRTALGKELVCRVPEGLHSANPLTLGKLNVSGSECFLFIHIFSVKIIKYIEELCLSYILRL